VMSFLPSWPLQRGITDSPWACKAWRRGLGTWRTQVVFLYLVVSFLFFRFVVLL